MPANIWNVPVSNRLLAAVAGNERDAIYAALEPVPMRARQVLHKQNHSITHVYFPQGAVASVTKSMDDGAEIEISSVGWEGIVGITVFLGEHEAVDQAIIQVSGPDGFRMDVDHFTRLLASQPRFYDLIRRYCVSSLTSGQQSVACNGLHDVAQRCARWLLMMQDRVQSADLPLTHEFLAIMLGVRRPSVTLAIGQLHNAGLVEAGRRLITVVNRPGLEQASCECYATVEREYARLLPECRVASTAHYSRV